MERGVGKEWHAGPYTPMAGGGGQFKKTQFRADGKVINEEEACDIEGGDASDEVCNILKTLTDARILNCSGEQGTDYQ